MTLKDLLIRLQRNQFRNREPAPLTPTEHALLRAYLDHHPTPPVPNLAAAGFHFYGLSDQLWLYYRAHLALPPAGPKKSPTDPPPQTSRMPASARILPKSRAASKNAGSVPGLDPQ